MSLVENLIYDYGDFKIDIPHWEIADHGVTALWGPSGSGKTSVFRLLIGLEYCSSLSWKFEQEDWAALALSEKRIGVVFQDLRLFPHLTAKENILFAARARKIAKQQVEDKIAYYAKALGIKEILERPTKVLSGGEKQRVAVARALIGEPRFLFLDEPFSSLDQGLREEARQLLKSVIDDLKIPTLLVTHDKEDLNLLADHIVVIEDGKLKS